MIEELTQKQKDMIPEKVAEWTEVGLCTKPADRTRAENAFEKVYAAASLAPPKEVVWVDSPLEGAKIRKSHGVAWHDGLGYGQMDSHWLAFYDFWAACGLEGPEKLVHINEIARSCCWWWALDTMVIATERPREILLDAQQRLHNTEGKAIYWPDGWGVYVVSGVLIRPEDAGWIEDRSVLTAAAITAQRNAEVRRVMTEAFGFDRYLEELGAKVLHEDRDLMGRPRLLVQAQVPGQDEALTMIKVINSTPEPDGHHKEYHLRVPPHMKSCNEAVAWTFGLDDREYKPLQET